MAIEPPLPGEVRVDDQITLRPIFEPSPEAMHALIHRNLDHIGEFLSWARPDYGVEGVRDFQQAKRQAWNRDGEQGFSIYFRGELAGGIGMNGFTSPVRAISIGYWLSAHLQGNGIMTRCVEALINLAFTTYGMNQVIIRAAPENLKSRAIPERLGFVEMGIERQMSMNARGEFLDLVAYSLLRSEWTGALE